MLPQIDPNCAAGVDCAGCPCDEYCPQRYTELEQRQQLNPRDTKGYFASNSPYTSALGRAGKKVSPWRFGVPWLNRPKKPDWVK